MNKISCDICVDLIPLVKDEIASYDSKNAVVEHIEKCETCRKIYGKEINFQKSDKIIVSKIKKNLTRVCVIIIILGILLGISLSSNQFMFYNIIIMPVIGVLSYYCLRKKTIYALLGVFVLVYLSFFYHSSGYLLQGAFLQAFIPPLWWALIYLGLTALGSLIAFLLIFGFRKGNENEKNN